MSKYGWPFYQGMLWMFWRSLITCAIFQFSTLWCMMTSCGPKISYGFVLKKFQRGNFFGTPCITESRYQNFDWNLYWNFFSDTKFSETEIFLPRPKFPKPKPKRFSETKFSETETETFFQDQIFPHWHQDFFSRPNSLKPILFLDQIRRNRNRNPQKIGKSLETRSFKTEMPISALYTIYKQQLKQNGVTIRTHSGSKTYCRHASTNFLMSHRNILSSHKSDVQNCQ